MLLREPRKEQVHQGRLQEKSCGCSSTYRRWPCARVVGVSFVKRDLLCLVRPLSKVRHQRHGIKGMHHHTNVSKPRREPTTRTCRNHFGDGVYRMNVLTPIIGDTNYVFGIARRYGQSPEAMIPGWISLEPNPGHLARAEQLLAYRLDDRHHHRRRYR